MRMTYAVSASGGDEGTFTLTFLIPLPDLVAVLSRRTKLAVLLASTLLL